jgi:hypothetical protein
MIRLKRFEIEFCADDQIRLIEERCCCISILFKDLSLMPFLNRFKGGEFLERRVRIAGGLRTVSN